MYIAPEFGFSFHVFIIIIFCLYRCKYACMHGVIHSFNLLFFSLTDKVLIGALLLIISTR